MAGDGYLVKCTRSGRRR